MFEAEQAESVTGIGFYTTGPYTAYRILLIPDYKDQADLARAAGDVENEQVSGSSSRILAAGQIANPGFHTVPVTGEVSLREGQRYAVGVWVNTPGESKPAAVELAKDRYTQSVTTKGRETWLSRTGAAWENTQEAYQTNVCMKVFTRDKELPGAPAE